MKEIQIIIMVVISVLLSNLSIGQNSEQNGELLDLKMKLIDSKMNLLESKLDLFEKNKEEKLRKLDSLIALQEKEEKNILSFSKNKNEIEPDYDYNFKSAISINPTKLFEGSLFISYERKVSNNFTIDGSIIGTYVTRNGIGGAYYDSQEINMLGDGLYANDAIYYNYRGEMLTGFGIILEGKNYLKHNSKTPLGIYAGPQLMYRRVNIIGQVYNWETQEPKDVTDYLDIFRGGVVIGTKIKFADVLCIDINIGGSMQLSKYLKESGTTKYKTWKSIDYSGILPTLNIKIGVLK